MTEPVFDLEMQALARIEEILCDFDGSATERMLAWLKSRRNSYFNAKSKEDAKVYVNDLMGRSVRETGAEHGA